jgi:glutamate racemase
MIGILGSGSDSMIVARSIREKIPDVDVVCFSDNLCIFPVDASHPDRIMERAVQGVVHLAGLGAGMILIASHTISCIAEVALAKSTLVPVLDILSATVDRAVLRSRYRRIGIMGSRAVIDSGRYPEKIRERIPEAGIHSVSCPLLMPLIDEGWIKKPVTAMIVKRYTIPLKTRQIDTLILAGTPYTLLSAVIQRKIGRRVQVIDGADALSETAVSYLSAHPDIAAQLQRTGGTQVMLAWPSATLEKQAKDILNIRNIEIAGFDHHRFS